MRGIQLLVGAWIAGLASCATAPEPRQMDDLARRIVASSFRAQGQASLDRLEQDEVQRACSAEQPPAADLARRLEAEQLAAVRWPADGVYLGDWREGEKLAQNGRGMTWSDPPGTPGGGGCYNCHQIASTELSYGTIGPSLSRYGRLRGVADPAAPASREVVRYTWSKLWNAKATNACSAMPRFGHAGVLSAAQLRDLMALLLDPASPVNAE